MNKKNENTIRTIRGQKAKKAIATLTMAACLVSFATINASAIAVAADFASSAQDALKTVVTLIGGALGAWGVVNLLEGYGNDNPGAKSQGIKQAAAGVGLVIVGAALIPAIFSTGGNP